MATLRNLITLSADSHWSIDVDSLFVDSGNAYGLGCYCKLVILYPRTLLKGNMEALGPKSLSNQFYGTMSLPKGGNSQGKGATIVEASDNKDVILATDKSKGSSHRIDGKKTDITEKGVRSLVLLSEINKANPKKVNLNLIHLVGNTDILILAYERIKSNPGNMTPGLKKETLDGIDIKYFEKISQEILAGKFEFKRARRKMIPKPNKPGEMRPLGIASPREKIVQKALQLVFQAIYEPLFLDCSHGFRPHRGVHSAMKSLSEKFKAATWVIEGDISKCFDTLKHDFIMTCLAKKIKCEKTLARIRSGLKAGYMDDLGNLHESASEGTPQGSVLSPRLCNVYMHELDVFMMERCAALTKGKTRKRNPDYRKLEYQISRRENAFAKDNDNEKLIKVQAIRQLMRNLPSKDRMDNNFTRVHYIRYADDFVVSVLGSHKLAVELKNELCAFLKGIGLNMKMDKSTITKFNEKPIRFLGIEIRNRDKFRDTRPVVTNSRGIQTRITPQIQLHADIQKIFQKLTTAGFFVWNRNGNKLKPHYFAKLVNLDHADILRFYNAIVRGYLSAYSFVDNMKSLGSIVHGLKLSCARTRAQKFKLKTAAKVFKKFGSALEDKEASIKFYLPDNFKRTRQFNIGNEFSLPRPEIFWWGKLTRSNIGKTCVVCDSSENVQMHHVRQIKNLMNKNLDWWHQQMAAINRKQVPRCKDHHVKLHQRKLSYTEMAAFKRGCENLVKKQD